MKITQHPTDPIHHELDDQGQQGDGKTSPLLEADSPTQDYTIQS